MTEHEQYYWSSTEGVLFHTMIGDEKVDPFFKTVEEAENFIERKAEHRGEEEFQGMVLRSTNNKKVKEATDVLTDQAGISDWSAAATDD